MIASLNFRDLYAPIQPSVNLSDDFVSYIEVLPSLSLQSKIHCYWRLKTNQSLQVPFVYRVVADGCIDIFFELQNPSESYVMGFCNTYTEFPLDNMFDYIGIRFYPTIFPQIFKINASELSNQFVYLNVVSQELSTFIASNFSPEFPIEQIKNLFDQYFIQKIKNLHVQPDSRLNAALSLILEKRGMIRVGSDLDTGLSPRQLRRIFEFHIGDSVKSFSKIVRFQNLIKSTQLSNNQDSKYFYELGYYDQSHFIKEFKTLFGATPQHYLSK